MVLSWIILGITSIIALQTGYYWIKFGAPWYALSVGASGIVLFLFAVVWALVSLNDGELLNAILGILGFGMIGILLLSAGWRLSEVHKSVVDNLIE